MPAVAIPIKTAYQSAHEALDMFLSIRKAEGLAKNTLDNYKHIIAPFLREHPRFLENPRPAVLSFVSEPEKEWSRFTRVKVMRAFCSFLASEGVLSKNPMENVKCRLPGKRADVPRLDDVKAFLAALDMGRYTERRLRTMVLLALDTGMRRGELCALRIEDIDERSLLIHLRPEATKTRKGRTVPVSPQVMREMRRFIALHPAAWRCPWVFPTEQGTKLNPDVFGRQIRRASGRTGQPLKIHGLRHLCATEFLRSTGNIALVAALLGHASISTTSRFYEHLDTADLQAAHGQAAVVSGVLKNECVRRV
ncbi:MAG: site-specific integrase [Aminobacteriaceae bacterium]